MKKERRVIEQVDSRPIVLDVTYKKDNTKKPIIIFCHGYKGFKDWGCWNMLASDVAQSDIFFLKFNFSHNGGTVNEPIDFPDLNAFGQNNFTKELDDLNTVIDYVTSEHNEFASEMNTTDITLVGHSRGGGIVVLKTNEDNRITRVITLAGVSDYKSRFPVGDALQHWKNKGVAYIENGRTKQQMPHFIQFYDNFIANEARLTISTAVQNIKIPFLIIHGTEDETVVLKEAKLMHQWNPNSKLNVIEGANHVFGSSHPWSQLNLPNELQEVSNQIIKFVYS